MSEVSGIVRRFQVSTRDAAETEAFIGQAYVGNRSRFLDVRDDARFAAMVGATAAVAASRVCSTVDYRTVAEPFDHFISFALTGGRVHVRDGRDERMVAAGETAFYPIGVPLEIDVFDVDARLLQLPLAVLAEVAEQTTGIRAADLRFTSAAPVSAAMARQWFALLELTGTALLGDDSPPAMPATGPLLAGEMARTAAITALRTFPNTALTAPHRPGPGWVAPDAVRRAAAFAHAHADRAVTLAEIAAAAGVSGRALQYAFRRHFGTTPIGYLRRVRLERAHDELLAADPAGALTVADVAYRWGWFSPARFAEAYQRRFGMAPGEALRR